MISDNLEVGVAHSPSQAPKRRKT
jgi:hypothetical protein